MKFQKTIPILIILLILIIEMSPIATSVSYNQDENKEEIYLSYVPRHPPYNSTLFGAPVLTSKQYLNFLNESIAEIRHIENILDSLSKNQSENLPICNTTNTSLLPFFSKKIWVYVNPYPLITVKDEKLIKKIEEYITQGGVNVYLFEKYIPAHEWLSQIQWLIPLESLVSSIQTLMEAVNKKNLSLFEFEYLILTMNYISLKSWGPGEFLCKCYVEPLVFYLFLANKPLSSEISSLALINNWYVSPEIAKCLHKWHVPPNSSIINTHMSINVAKNLSDIIKQIILYLPDSKMRFFLPVPFVLIKGAIGTLSITGTELKGINKTSSSSSTKSENKKGEGMGISIKVLGHGRGSPVREINIKDLAEIAGSIFSSMETAGGSVVSSQQSLVIPKLPVRGEIKVNVSDLLNGNFLVPHVGFKKVGSILARVTLGENLVKKISKVELQSKGKINPLDMFLMAALLSLIVINRKAIFSLLRLKRLSGIDERRLVFKCYRTLLEDTSKYAQRKSTIETPREYLEKVRGKVPELFFFNLSKATEIYELVRYGDKKPSRKDIEFCIKVLREKRFVR